MDEIRKFWRDADEARDLHYRAMAVYPVERDFAALRVRHESGDPNVTAIYDEDERVIGYELGFTREQQAELIDAYHQAKGTSQPPGHREDPGRVFVSIIEDYGQAILDLQRYEPPEQKKRERSIESFAKAIERVDATLAEMDSAALGWLYALSVDKLAAEGVQVSSEDSRIVRMRDHHQRAMVEAGELRQSFRAVAAAVVAASAEAEATLPKAERRDPRFVVATWLERQVLEHGLEFVTTEKGFPARCLRAVCDLARVETEKVSYWLKKAADDPDSHGRWLEKMRQQNDGKKPPAV